MLDNHPNLLTETLLTLKQAAETLPVRRTPQTVKMWIRQGCDGRKLESTKIGGRRYTSKEALDRFLNFDTTPPTAQTPKTQLPSKALIDLWTQQLGLKSPLSKQKN
jgi:hypothetical protein